MPIGSTIALHTVCFLTQNSTTLIIVKTCDVS